MTITDERTPVRRKRPKDRREQIIREAFQLIADSGFNAVSLGDIAKACGIQKSSVLHHFPSMNHLLFAVLNLREEQDYAFYSEQPEEQDPTDPGSARRRFTRVFLHNMERREFVRLYTILLAESLADDHPAHEYFIERTRQARNVVAQSLQWKPDPVMAAAELLAFWEGLELTWRHDESLDPRAVWESFCDRFFA